MDFGGVCANFVGLNEGLLGVCDGIGYIPLSQGEVAMVDEADYASLIRYKWCAIRASRTFYASAYVKSRNLTMHRMLMGPPKGMVVDHINHNGLDNRRGNLRICTIAQNSRNRQPGRGEKVKYKGVSFYKSHQKFRASIRRGDHRLTIGYFEDEVAAAVAYDEKAKELFGEYAYLNFPEK